MTNVDRAETIMTRMGFSDSDNGPMVSELRNEIVEQVRDRGLVSRSAGTWAPECGPAGRNLSAEERARAHLEVEWALSHGYCSEMKCLDRPWGKRINVRTMKRTYYIVWDDLPVWAGDRWRSAKMKARIAWDRLRGIRNPYARS
jgi:hypothetical protein